MAGKRRRGEGLPPRPKLRHVKAERRRERLAAELAAASLPQQRLTVAVDYVRTCLQATGLRVSGPAAASPAGTVAELVRELVDAGDRLWAVRRRARLQTEMAAAATAGDQLTVALDYVRRPLAGSDDPTVQQTAGEVLEPLVRRLVAAGEQMQKEVR